MVFVKSHEELGRLPRGEEINGLVKLMDKGEKLVEECSRLKWWKQSIRFAYANKLQKLDKELLAFFQRDIVAACITSDLAKVLKLVEEIRERVVTSTSTGSDDDQVEGGGCASHGDEDAAAGLHVKYDSSGPINFRRRALLASWF